MNANIEREDIFKLIEYAISFSIDLYYRNRGYEESTEVWLDWEGNLGNGEFHILDYANRFYKDELFSGQLIKRYHECFPFATSSENYAEIPKVLVTYKHYPKDVLKQKITELVTSIWVDVNL